MKIRKAKLEDAKEISNEEIIKAVNFQEKWFDSVVIRF